MKVGGNWVRWLVFCLVFCRGVGLAADKLVGGVAPGFALPDLNGKTVRLSEFRGKVVVLVFWAFWCDPWKDTAKTLKAVGERLSSLTLQVLCVTIDPSWKEIGIKAKRRGEFPSPVLLDKGSRVRKRYGITKVPTVLLIDADGVIRVGFLGCPRHEVLTAAVYQTVQVRNGERSAWHGSRAQQGKGQ